MRWKYKSPSNLFRRHRGGMSQGWRWIRLSSEEGVALHGTISQPIKGVRLPDTSTLLSLEAAHLILLIWVSWKLVGGGTSRQEKTGTVEQSLRGSWKGWHPRKIEVLLHCPFFLSLQKGTSGWATFWTVSVPSSESFTSMPDARMAISLSTGEKWRCLSRKSLLKSWRWAPTGGGWATTLGNAHCDGFSGPFISSHVLIAAFIHVLARILHHPPWILTWCSFGEGRQARLEGHLSEIVWWSLF